MTRKNTSGVRTKTTSKSTPRRSSSKKPSSGTGFRLNLPQKMLIAGIITIFVTAVFVLSLLAPDQGELTAWLSGLLGRLFGWGALFVPVMTGALGLYLVFWGMDQRPSLPFYRIAGVLRLQTLDHHQFLETARAVHLGQEQLRHAADGQPAQQSVGSEAAKRRCRGW